MLLVFDGELFQIAHQFISDGVFDHDGRQGHTALSGTAAKGIDNAVGGPFDFTVAQYQGVIFGLAECLNPLAVGGGGRVDVFTDFGRTDK